MSIEVPIWRQYTYFIECPFCDHVEVLGEDLSPDESQETACEKCGEKFVMTWKEPGW